MVARGTEDEKGEGIKSKSVATSRPGDVESSTGSVANNVVTRHVVSDGC